MVVDKQVLAQLVKYGAKYLKAALKKDAEARYSLLEDWVLPIVRAPLPDYTDEAFCILSDGEDSLVTVKAFASDADHPLCDGATGAPDNFLGVDIVPASVFHDRWYDAIPRIHAMTGVPLKELRRVGDKIFASIILAENGNGPLSKLVASGYYYGVRLFGGSHVKVLKAVAKTVGVILLVSVFCAGCSGCVETILNPDGYIPPVVAEVK